MSVQDPHRFGISDSLFFTLITRVKRFLLFQVLAVQLVLLLHVVPFSLISELVNGTLRLHRANGRRYFQIIHFKSDREWPTRVERDLDLPEEALIPLFPQIGLIWDFKITLNLRNSSN